MRKITSSLFFFLLFSIMFPLALSSQNNTIASVTVFHFLEDGKKITPLSTAITEAFETALLKTGAYKLVEKKQIGKVLEQQGFQNSGLTDETQAVEVGRILNSQYIIVGSVSRLSQIYLVNVRLINITTGEIEKGESMRGSSEAHLIENMQILAIKIAGENTVPSIGDFTTDKNSLKGLVFLNSGSVGMKYRILDQKGKERFRGETPNSLELPFGSYIIKTTDPQQLYKDYEATFVVDSEKKITIQIAPEENFYTLEVKGYGGTLFIDGKEEGAIPYRGKVPIATHRLKVIPQSQDFETWEKEVDPPRGRTLSVIADLKLHYIKRLVKTNPDLELMLYVDNKPVGTTPDRFLLPCGIRDFTLSGKDLNGKPINYSARIEIDPQPSDQPLVLNISHLISTPSTESSSLSGSKIGEGATIQSENGNSLDFISDSSPFKEYTSLFIGGFVKYFTDFSSHYVEPGATIGLLYRMDIHYFDMGIALAYRTNELTGKGTDVGMVSVGLDFIYKYRFDELSSVGLHWTPGALFDLAYNDIFFINDLAASISVELADFLSIYYKLGIRTQSSKTTFRSYILNELGFHLDPFFIQ